MPAPTPCVPCCSTPQIVNVPGLDSTVAGPAGPNTVTAATTTDQTGILTGDGANVGSVANPLPIANGGTGAATQAAALTAILGSSIVPVANGGTGVAVAPALVEASPVNPVGTTSATAVMMGLGVSITPATSGTVLVIITGMIGNSTIDDGASVQIVYGTSTAPNNGDPATGTTLGRLKNFVASTDYGKQGFSLAFLATSLTVGTPYWIDVGLNAVTGGTANIYDLDVVAIEQ